MSESNASEWRQRSGPDPVDIHVGGRIRMRRILLGKSQEVVAAHLGVSFQQLQKYESGANRVSASRLFDLAHILMAPISYFFEEIPAELGEPVTAADEAESRVGSVMSSRMTLDLIRDFYRIGSAHQQRCIIDLVRAMADAGGGDAEPAPGAMPIRNSTDRRKARGTA